MTDKEFCLSNDSLTTNEVVVSNNCNKPRIPVCQWKDCVLFANFNYETETKAIYCQYHKSSGMIDIKKYKKYNGV